MGDPVTTMTGLAAVGQLYTGVKQEEAARKAEEEQKDMLEAQQETERKAIEASKGRELSKRKDLIKKQRKQVVGETDYTISQTGETGVTAAPTLTGDILG